MKLLVVGIDGGSWDMINPLVERGEMPTLKKLIDGGVHGKLKSTIPPQTIPAWPTMFTGKNPGELGVAGFLAKRGNKFMFANTDLWRGQFVWDKLSSRGYKVGVLNVPGSYPAYKINGVMITGMLTPSKEPHTYPSGILDDEDYQIDPETEDVLSGEGAFQELVKVNQKRYTVFKKLADRYEFDVSIMVFTMTDRVQHYMWNDRKKVEESYKIIDKEISYFFKKYKNTIVVSDHGFTKLEKPFFINDWLEENGYLKRKFTLRSKVLEMMPRSLMFWLMKFVPRDVKKVDTLATIDMKRTKAFVVCDNSIFLNDKSLLDEILDKLNKFDFLKAYSSEELFGVNNPNMPEIVIEPKEGSFCYQVPRKVFDTKIRKGGEHTRDGIFIGYGKHVKKVEKIENITPLILKIMKQK